MNKFLMIVTALFCFAGAMAQPNDDTTDKRLKDQVLKEISDRLEVKNQMVDSTVFSLNRKIDSLNQKITESRNVNEKAVRLQERINAIEEKQKAIEQAEVNVYQANYQSAVINLVSMEREIKPLILFNTTKSFFSQLDAVSNPMNYSGYKQWFGTFQEFVEENKNNDAILNVTSTLLNFTGNVSGFLPLSAPVTQALFGSMSSYINNLSKRKRELREQSEKMFSLTMKLSQFNYDKNAIEAEWQTITKELEELQKHYEKIKKENFTVLKVKATDFDRSFTAENDAFKRLKYLNALTGTTAQTVEVLKAEAPKDWKEKVHHQMMDVQALKTRFGNITFRVKENIARYSDLIKRYKSDPDLGPKLVALESKLKDLAGTFDDTFNPIEYVNSATRMYKVH